MFILLDIDGVMVPAKSWESPPLLSDGMPAFSAIAVSALAQCITPDTTVLLTTSHKNRFSVEEWKAIFHARGLSVPQLEILAVITAGTRLEELMPWLNLNDPEQSYVIIDDDKSLHGLPPEHKKNWIATDAMIGLCDHHVETIQASLKTVWIPKSRESVSA